MVEYRAEVRGAAAGELEVLHIIPQVLQIVKHIVGADLVVALDNTDVHFSGKGPRAPQNRVGTGQKLPDPLPGGGHGGVHGDDEILDPLFLPGLRRLHQGHVSVKPEAVGVEAVVKGVGVHRRHLPGGGEAAEKRPVVHVVPDGRPDLLQHGLAAGPLVGEDRLQARLGFAGEVLPFLVLAAALLLIVLPLRVPEPVVVHQKGPLELGDFILRQVQPQKAAVDALRRQHRHVPLALAVELLLPGSRSGVETGVVQFIQNTLHRRVAAEVPQLRELAPLLRQMPEHAVENHMEIGPAGPHPAPQIAVRQPGPVVVQRLAVGGQGHRDPAAGGESQGAEGRVQIGQAHIQLVPGGEEDVPPNPGKVLLFHKTLGPSIM